MLQTQRLVCYRIYRQIQQHVIDHRMQPKRLDPISKVTAKFRCHRCYSSRVTATVLGIETSCDDTGCAVVDSSGKILGEALNSQQQIHLNHGGIIPPIARDLHQQHIEHVVQDALRLAGIQLSEVDAIATTVKPGLPLSLLVGMNYGKHLSSKSGKPFIPVHHMEAHALTIRMVQKVCDIINNFDTVNKICFPAMPDDSVIDFPFLVLLISGGHCLLAVAQAVDKFVLLGQSLDDAPGEAFDKAARRLKLRNLPEFRALSGGEAIELAASKSLDAQAFEFPTVMTHYRNCNFSFSGLKNSLRRHILQQEKLHGVEGDEVIPDVFNLCASFQMSIARHLCQRVQRGMEFVALRNLLPSDNRTLNGLKERGSLLLLEMSGTPQLHVIVDGIKLMGKAMNAIKRNTEGSVVVNKEVVSGGVACNGFIKRALGVVCQEMGYSLAVPPPHLCTDNGIMIAWNGVERLWVCAGVTHDLDAVDILSKCPLGEDWTEVVAKANIKCKWIKLSSVLKQHTASGV